MPRMKCHDSRLSNALASWLGFNVERAARAVAWVFAAAGVGNDEKLEGRKIEGLNRHQASTGSEVRVRWQPS